MKRVQSSQDINFFSPSLNFPLMISFLTLPPFFHVPAPTQKFPGGIVTWRYALGLQEERDKENHRQSWAKQEGWDTGEQVYNSGGSDDGVIDTCDRS